LWSKFDKVEVWASIDAIGPRAEYLRHGTNWKKINGNLKTMLANKHIRFSVTPVISLFNALHMPDYIDHLMDLGFSCWQILMGNILINPEPYALAMLPDHLKDQVRKTYDKFLEDKKGVYGERTLNDFKHKFQSIINYLDAPLEHQGTRKDLARRFIYMTRVLDRVRNENFVETYPELKDYWDACLEEIDPERLDPDSDLFYF
jgi:MoaA/NifB/PqqE/SkfB family radical SAM enzyme